MLDAKARRIAREAADLRRLAAALRDTVDTPDTPITEETEDGN
jgi:hypothetical protein